ncbi:glycosyltransferase family 2 protein [Soonwooa sp.]|uniref:glycosyltransferase family 2 protein n=1 Tax=Soonwooa sp. TaxID=1938592 RepID=UPI0028A71EA1|nr:glycosyltransferase family 2 protein [Soonwooa sp.]
MKPMISVIVPVFNGEKIVSRIINNILKQTYANFELILVDDCSTDNTSKIIEKWKLKDKRIRLINQEQNQRPLRCRLDGVRIAKGDWIMFVDADDYLYTNALANMIPKIEEDVDVILGSYCNTYDRFGITKSKPINIVPNKCIETKVVFRESPYQLAFWGAHSIFVSSWAKLYRKTIFSELLCLDFDKIYSFDDTLMNLLLFENVREIVFIKDKIINYKYGGGTSSLNRRNIIDLNELYKYRTKLLEKSFDAEKCKFADYEYMNVVYQHFLNGIVLESWTLEEFKEEFIRNKELAVFEHVLAIAKNYNTTSSKFLQQSKSNLEQFYNDLNRIAAKVRMKRLVKRKIGKILSRL